MTKQQPKGIRVTKDGGLIIHPEADVSEGSSIRIPQVSTALGAGFGDEITDNDREFAAKREPVAHFLTFGIANDVFDKWFIVDDPSTEGGDPKTDEAVQNALTKLKAKAILTKALEYERTHGWSLLVGSFSDVSDVNKLEQPLRQGNRLLQLTTYPKTKVEVWLKDENEKSHRFGEALIYKVDRGDGKYLYIHHSRCFKLMTRSTGLSALDPIWDDLNCGRNIRWGTAQWMYRNGGGFPVIKFPVGTTLPQLEEWMNSSAFTNLMARTYIGITGDMDFDFRGAQGRALDPQPFFQTNLEQISAGSGVPEPMLRGAQAGAVTGSEVNQQQYYKVISRIQASLEDCVRWVIDRLAEAGQIEGLVKSTDKSLSEKVKRWIHHDAEPIHESLKYKIEWVSAFELTELDEANAELLKEQANQTRLQYMTVDEVRALNELDPLPNGEGSTLQAKQPQPQAFEFPQGDSYLVTQVNRHRPSLDEDECTAGGGVWRTIKGMHVCIKSGESVEQAFERTTGKTLEGGVEEQPKDLTAGETEGKGEGKTMKIDFPEGGTWEVQQQAKKIIVNMSPGEEITFEIGDRYDDFAEYIIPRVNLESDVEIISVDHVKKTVTVRRK